MTEYRRCNSCGEAWLDTGDLECPFCFEDDTEAGFSTQYGYDVDETEPKLLRRRPDPGGG